MTDFERFDLGSLSERRGAKWSDASGDVLPAWIADMDLPLARPVVEVLEQAVSAQDLGYPSSADVDAVVESFVARSASRHAFEVDPDLVVVASDVVQSIYVALMAFSEPGDGVVVQTPVYPPFLSAVADTGRRLVEVPLELDGDGYRVDTDRLRNAVRAQGARVMLVCNPHNPTGRVMRTEELEAIGAVAEDENLVLVVDEIHADLVYQGSRHVPLPVAAPAAAGRCVTLASASKAFNIAGLRCSVASFGSRALYDRFGVLPSHARGGLSCIGLRATAAAWNEGDRWLADVVSYLEGNRDTVAAALAPLEGVVSFAPEATYLSWIDLSGLGMGPDPAEELKERAGLLLSSGPAFGGPGRGHVRLNFATTRAVLDQILGRLVTHLQRAAAVRSSG